MIINFYLASINLVIQRSEYNFGTRRRILSIIKNTFHPFFQKICLLGFNFRKILLNQFSPRYRRRKTQLVHLKFRDLTF